MEYEEMFEDVDLLSPEDKGFAKGIMRYSAAKQVKGDRYGRYGQQTATRFVNGVTKLETRDGNKENSLLGKFIGAAIHEELVRAGIAKDEQVEQAKAEETNTVVPEIDYDKLSKMVAKHIKV